MQPRNPLSDKRTFQGLAKLRCPHLEAQDDGPDEAEGQPVVPIHDVMGAHVLKMDSLLLQELKGLVHILQTVDAHASLGGFRLETGAEGRNRSYNGA